MNYLQGKNRDPNVENGLVNTKEKKEGEQTERGALTYIYCHDQNR